MRKIRNRTKNRNAFMLKSSYRKRKKEKNAGSEKSLPTLIEEEELLWYWVPLNPPPIE